jgi:hypothetical protein
MKVTWHFLAGLVVGFVLVLGLMLAAFWLNLGVPSGSTRWSFELNHRKRLMAEHTPSPRLLLVGGSATLFGLNAREIEAQTGIHTINLGTHAALGTACILRVAQQDARPGDTVLLVLEYELYNYGKVKQSWAHNLLVDYLVSRDPSFLRSLTLPEKWTVFMLTPTSRLIEGLKNRFRAEPPYNDDGLGIYSLRNLDAWGDLSHHTREHRLANREAIVQSKSALGRGLPEHPEGFGPIESFCRWAQTNDIRVLATFPNLCDRSDYHGPVAEQSAQIVRGSFSRLNVPVIGNYTNALFPEDQFLDTMYHLTEEAALARTQRLIPDLKAALTASSTVSTSPSNSAKDTAP